MAGDGTVGEADPGSGWLRPIQAALLLLAFYRGSRIPNPWSLSYYQVTWADGFFRRGLLGTLLLPLGCARFDPAFVHVLQGLALGACIAALLWLGRRGSAAWFLCLLLLADAGVFLFNEAGYLDPWMVLFGLGCWVLLRRGRPGWTALLLAASVLVHEMAVFTVLPALLVFRLRLPRERRPSLGPLLAPLALVLAGLLAASGPVSDATLGRFGAKASVCGHSLERPDFERDYQQSLRVSLKSHYQPGEPVYLLLPFALALGWALLAGGLLGSAPRREQWATLAACLSPFLLGLLAWDSGRWYFLALLQVLLMLGTRGREALGDGKRSADSGTSDAVAGKDVGPKERDKGKRLPLATRMLRVAPLVAVVGLTPIPRFDGSGARPLSAAAAADFGRAAFTQLRGLSL